MKKACISGVVLAAIVLVGAASIPHAAPLADPFTLTVYEQTGSIDAYTFQSTDPLLYAKRSGYPGPVGWGGTGYDFGTGGCEYYDLFFSDSLGNVLALSPGDPLPAPTYLTIVCMDLNCNDGSITPAPTWVGAGNNIDAVKISYGGANYWANGVLQATYGLCDEPFSAKTSNFADAALGPQDAGITKMGCGPSTLTLRFSPVPPPPTLTVYEQTGSINAYTFQSTDPLLYAKRSGYPGPANWGGSGYDFGTGGCEYYDLFFSDSLGNVLALSPGDPLPAPTYLTIVCMDLNCNDGSITPAPTWVGAGNNIDAVKITYGGTDYWSNAVLQATYGLCDEPFSAKTSNFADAALGPQDAGITKMGCGPSTLTLRIGNPVPAPPDTTPPMLTGATATSASLIALVFDEKLSEGPAETVANYTLFETGIPSNVIAVSSATLAGDGSRVQLVLSTNLVSGRSYTISVSNITDLKGNVIPPGTSLVFVYVDTVPPALLSAHAAVSTAVLARFSEMIDNVTAENADNYLVFETANPAVTVPVSVAALSGDSSSVLLTLGSALENGVAYSLKATGVADRAGNPVPAGSVVPITRPDMTPPHLSAAEAITLTYVSVAFDEPVTGATAGLAANYVLIPADDPGSTFSPSSVDLPDSRTAGLRFIASLGSGAMYTVRVSNVADTAGNVIAPGSEKTFVCPSIPSGSGEIGLFADADHSDITVDYAGASTPFNVYVWSHPGGAGMMAAEFSVVFPSNVIFAGYTMNPLVAVFLGDITQDLSVAYSACQREWTWILKADCYLINDDKTLIGFGPGPIFANCSVGYPIESANVLGRIYCNGGVATLSRSPPPRASAGRSRSRGA